MSQPDPSPTQASSWPQPSLGSKKPPLQHIDLRCSSYQNKLWHCFLQLCSFLLQAPSLSCWCGECNAAAPQHLLASVPETLPSSPSPTLTWCQSKLQHCSELVLSSLCSQPVPRDTFLRLPEVSQKEKPSWALPMPPKLFYRQRSDHHFFFCLFPSFTLSLVAWLRG